MIRVPGYVDPLIPGRKPTMSNYRRSREPGAIYFFTLVTHRRQPVLTTVPLRQALRQSIQEVRASYPFRIHGWALLPDHLHCIWQLPLGDEEFGLRWSIIKRRVSQQVGRDGALSASRAGRRELGLWQRRFWEHRIRDEVGLPPAHGLPALESGQARAGSTGRRLALVEFPPTGAGGGVSAGLGRLWRYRRCFRRVTSRRTHIRPNAARTAHCPSK